MTSADSRLCTEQGNFGTQQLESYLEELRIDKQDMIDPPKEARGLVRSQHSREAGAHGGFPRVVLLGADARLAQTRLTIREPEEGSAASAGVVHT